MDQILASSLTKRSLELEVLRNADEISAGVDGFSDDSD